MTNQPRLGRRSFLKAGISGLAGAVIRPSALKSAEKITSAGNGTPNTFIHRELGNTGVELPVISMGVMNADNPNLVAAALDAGIIHLDTAHGYQKGKNKEMIGEVVKNRKRDSFVIATKVGYPAKDRNTGIFFPDTTEATFQKEFDTSLKRLGLDYVDILYIHSIWTRESVFFEPAMRFLDRVKKEGKVCFSGLTTHRNEHEVINAVTDSKFYDVVLTAYNFRRKNCTEIQTAMANAARAGIGIIAMKTQAGVYWDQERQEKIDMRAALKWAIRNKNVHTSIPGFTTFDQLNEDLSVMENLNLTPEERKNLRLDEPETLSGLYCQQCDACRAQCPYSVEIPTFMRSYMYAYGYRNLELAQETLKSAELASLPCYDCRQCSVDCPMGFDVRTKILDIVRLENVLPEFLS
jgi:predicted aldo/keto reductase-like oxidoreductase